MRFLPSSLSLASGLRPFTLAAGLWLGLGLSPSHAVADADAPAVPTTTAPTAAAPDTPPASPSQPTAAPAPAADGLAALDARALRAPRDEAPHTVRRHYLWSNERRHDLFFPSLAGLGGAYMGVGGDQNYTLAAAASADVLWLIDLDQAVVYLHRLYAALLPVALTPAELVALFDKRHRAEVHAAVATAYPEAEEQRAVLQIYHAYRDLLHGHLQNELHRSHSARGTWLSDARKYQHMQRLARAGRIISRLGDLTGPTTLHEIADTARRASVPIHVIYLSNAESWFSYGPAFRSNLSGLPFDDRSVILRTIKSAVLPYPSGDIWHYTLQRAQHFAEGLARPAYRSIDVAMADAVPHKIPGVSLIGFPLKPGQTPLLAAKGSRDRRDAKSSLIASGLVTRPAGNRETAREMDRDRLHRAQLELSRAN